MFCTNCGNQLLADAKFCSGCGKKQSTPYLAKPQPAPTPPPSPTRRRPTPDYADFIHERTQVFTGREWVFEAINDWLANAERDPVFLLTGEPGCGKSAISARLTQFSQGNRVTVPANCALPSSNLFSPDFLSAFHFCSARSQTFNNPHTFITFIAYQLAERYPAYAQALVELSGDGRIELNVQQTVQTIQDEGKQSGVVITNLNVSKISVEDAFVQTIAEPLARLYEVEPSEQIVILVDALDEALSYTSQPTIVDLLSQTADLPNVRFLLTSRQEQRIVEQFVQADGLCISAAEN